MKDSGVSTLRRFTTLAVAVTILAAGLPAEVSAQLPSPRLPQRGYATGKYALLLDGVYVGILPAVSSNFAVGGLVVEEPGGGTYVRKHLGEADFSEITLVFSAGMSSSLYEWVGGRLSGNDEPKDGSVIALDSNYRAVGRVDFLQARISELNIPRLAAGSKEELLFRLTIKPQRAERSIPFGQFSPRCRVTEPPLTGNFRLDLLAGDTSKGTVIEPLTIKLPLPELRDGRLTTYMPPTNFPNLEVGFPAASLTAARFENWVLSFIRSGYSGEAFEMSGTLEFLSRDMNTPFFILRLEGVGIYSLEPPQAGQGPSGQAPTSWGRMYVERMFFESRSQCGGGEPVQTH